MDEKHAEFLELISWRPPREAAKAWTWAPTVSKSLRSVVTSDRFV